MERQWLNYLDVLFVYLWRWLIATPLIVASFIGPFVLGVIVAIQFGDRLGNLGFIAVVLILVVSIFIAAMVWLLVRKLKCGVLSLSDDAAVDRATLILAAEL